MTGCGRKIGPYDCCTVVCGDCLELMKAIPDRAVDAVITDPPYGLDFRGNGWDSHIPDWFKDAKRIGLVVMFTTAPTTAWDYPRPDWVLNWYRPASSARNYAGGFNHWSPILLYGKIKPEVDVINLHAIANAYPAGFGHPSPKPEALVEWLVGLIEGDAILDPFLGSGTTAVAAKRLGRHFLGFEISPEYVAIANKRIELVEMQPSLFKPKPEQLTL